MYRLATERLRRPTGGNTTAFAVAVIVGPTLFAPATFAQTTPVTAGEAVVSHVQDALSLRPNYPVSREATDMVIGVASAKAVAFLKSVGLQSLGPPTRTQLVYDVFDRRVWELRAPGYLVSLDSRTGDLYRFKNYAREADKITGRRYITPSQIRTEQQAVKALWKYARLAGIPQSAHLGGSDRHNESNSVMPWANRAGLVIGRFTIDPPNGIPYHRMHGPGMSIVIDPLDGVLMELNQEWRVTALPATAKLAREDAIKIATALYGTNRWHRLHGSWQVVEAIGGAAPPPSGRASLQYVVPNQERFGAKRTYGMGAGRIAAMRFPRTARLAWVVKFGIDEIWISAVDGTQLGGIEYK